MRGALQLFTSNNCPRCKTLKQFLRERGVQFEERDIAEPEHRVDALLNEIYEIPGLILGNRVLRAEQMFEGSRLKTEAVLQFLHED